MTDTNDHPMTADAILALLNYQPTSSSSQTGRSTPTRTVESVEYPRVPASLAVEFASGADATESWHRYCDEHGLRITPTPREVPAVSAARYPECVEQWPEAESGLYDPRCCRFPKSCSANVPVEGGGE